MVIGLILLSASRQLKFSKEGSRLHCIDEDLYNEELDNLSPSLNISFDKNTNCAFG